MGTGFATSDISKLLIWVFRRNQKDWSTVINEDLLYLGFELKHYKQVVFSEIMEHTEN